MGNDTWTTAANAVAGGLSFIPGFGQIASAGIGLGSQIASWIMGNKKFDWGAWKDEQLRGIDNQYNQSLSNAVGQANKSFNATMGQTTNAQGLAGGISGVNAPGRVNAQTYANVAQNRDNAVTGITNGLEQNRAAMKASVVKEAAQGSQQEDFNAPTALDYLSNLTKILTPQNLDNLAMLGGGVLGGIGSLFTGGNGNTPNKPVQGVTLNTIGNNTVSPLANNPSMSLNTGYNSFNNGLNFSGGLLNSKYKYPFFKF